MSLPEILKGKLEIGNIKQIEALKELRRQVAEQEKQTKLIKDGILKQYRVEINYSGSEYRILWATSEKEAEDISQRIRN